MKWEEVLVSTRAGTWSKRLAHVLDNYSPRFTGARLLQIITLACLMQGNAWLSGELTSPSLWLTSIARLALLRTALGMGGLGLTPLLTVRSRLEHLAKFRAERIEAARRGAFPASSPRGTTHECAARVTEI